jgi:hypothetical protein
LVLESDPWSVLESLFYHPLRGSGISAAWIFLQSSVVVSLSFCLQLYRSDDSAVVSWNIWNACMNFVLRSTQLQTECGCSREYQFRTKPSQVMMKDLASATSSWVYGWFVPHEELSRVSETIVFREILVWTLVAMVQFAALWKVMI